MDELDNNLFDLGSESAREDFDPFGTDDNVEETAENNPSKEVAKIVAPLTGEVKAEKSAPRSNAAEPRESEKAQPGFTEKPPVFEYAGATENIDDASKTFDELRIEKSADFPELEDGKRVSWTVEYGKVTKTVADPKGMSIGRIKSEIETSKEFTDNMKKPRADKNPICKVKPRVTAQSKGNATSYRGVFSNMDEVNVAGKVISVLPVRDGKVYEIRSNEIGKFITPVSGCDLLSDVRAGFIPALPLIPMDLMMRIVSFFRYYMRDGNEQEVLVNIYWDKHSRAYVVDAPEQTVTKISVESTENFDYTDARYIHYMDIHSHNNMNAYFSAVDDKDEQATRLYSVIGRLDKYFPDIKTRISNGGKFMEIDPGEVFEYVAKPFPDEWKNVVRFRSQNCDDKDEFISDPGVAAL